MSAARTIVTSSRPLTPPEIVTVLSASRQAIAGKICKLGFGPVAPGPIVLMGADGRPLLMRAESGYDFGGVGFTSSDGKTVRTETSGHVDVITVTRYTREPAKKCDGTDLGAELVFEYEHKSTTGQWTATARTWTDHEFFAPIFNVLSGVTPVESGNLSRVVGSTARAFSAPFTLPAGAQAASPELQSRMRQSLLIDTTSLLPLRWLVGVPANPAAGTPAFDYPTVFTCDAVRELQTPEGIAAPTCVR